MTSGIYKLEFPGGLFYIGKSSNIERRWKEHFTKFEKGTAAKPLQTAYNNCGAPKTFVLCKAHTDNIDVLEAAYISAALETNGPKCLNTSIPEDPGFRRYEDDIANMSFKDQMDHILKLRRHIASLEQELEQQELDHKNEMLATAAGRKVLELETDFANVAALAEQRLETILRLKNRNWFQRLFNM